MKAMPTSKKQFAMCVASEEYDDLEVWKVYQVLRDTKAAGLGCIRVIDESGEDYLYPADRFAAVAFPKLVQSQPAEMAARQRQQGARRGRQEQAAAERLIVGVLFSSSGAYCASRGRLGTHTGRNACATGLLKAGMRGEAFCSRKTELLRPACV